MKHILPFLSSLLVVFIITTTSAQTVTNVEKLNTLSIELSEEWEINQVKVLEFCRENNLPVRQELEDGRLIQMVNVEHGIPLYYITDNLGAAKTTRADEVWPGGNAGFEITGAGYDKLGEWDGGHVRTTHVEFTDQGESRVTNMDGNTPTHFHATHVAGTMVAGGVSSSAKGMAYEGQLKSWDWNNDNSEMATAAASGLEVSNHSYGFGTGWHWNGSSWQWLGHSGIDPLEDYKFGFYSGDSRSMDIISYNAPYYLIFRSAGNDRGEGPSDAGQGNNPEKDGGTDGYDCISHDEIAKNIMTVGAVHQVSEYNGPGDVVMSSFSCWGPADDGRIKPDIVGKGVSVYSTNDGSDNSYMTMDGTSMSSPNVSGSAALLQAHYQDLYNNPMRAATLKGLIIHSADEAGSHDGPDYIYGWGLMNTERAAMIISQDTLQNVIDELVLADGEAYTRTISAPGDTALRVTICWTDVPGIPVGPELNPRDPMLVNDLDIRVVRNGNTYYPYSLDPENPSDAPTTDGTNNVDNVEMIYIENAPAGSYNVYVEHKGTLEEGEQAFSFFVSGNTDLPLPGCSDALLTPENEATDIFLNQTITWEPADYAFSYDVYFGTDGEGISTPTNVYNGENMENNGFYYVLDPDTTYYLKIIPRNDQGPAENCNDVWSFSTMEAVTAFPFADDYTQVDPPDLPFGYQAYDFSEALWESNSFIGHNDKYSMICLHPDGLVETDYDNWLISPPFFLTGEKEYDISFYYKNTVPGTNESISLYTTTDPDPEEITDKIFQDLNFDENSWQLGTATVETENDEVTFFAFHITSNDGYGVSMDDFTVEGWSVDVNEQVIEDHSNVYGYDSKLFISLNESWIGADIKVVNLIGQSIYTAKYHSSFSVDLRSNTKQGLHVVSIVKGDQRISKKLLLR